MGVIEFPVMATVEILDPSDGQSFPYAPFTLPSTHKHTHTQMFYVAIISGDEW